MLPKPDFSFTIPSIHDGANLECRVYHLKTNHPKLQRRGQKRGAVFAHPYAPLGGCFDDPVVASVGLEILKAGFILGTFNFRGAGASQGSTSWTARAELSDYISFAGFFLWYLQGLDPNALDNLDEEQQSIYDPAAIQPSERAVYTRLGKLSDASAETVVVFGGYSYGSMICLNLPSISNIVSHFANSLPGSSETEIRLRALHLSKQSNNDLRPVHKNLSEVAKESLLESTHRVRFGGDESESGIRNRSKHSKHGLDAVRKSFDVKRVKRSMEKHSAEQSRDLVSLPTQQMELHHSISQSLRCNYLLVSPLLPPISAFATMFTKLKARKAVGDAAESHLTGDHESAEPDSTKKLIENSTLALYGDEDLFTSHKKLRRWAESLKSVDGSCFDFHEIAGAGHFWHEERAVLQMRTFVGTWLKDCLSPAGL